jgi:Dolichyl-phosphate-mannose-protein mannosyltransferase
MSATAVSTHPPAQKTFTRKYTHYSVFILCASMYLLPFMRLLLRGTDEGTLLYGAVRVAHGQVLAHDFFEVMGPGTFYWLAAFFKLFGVTFMATRICIFVMSLGTGLLIYFLSRRICSRFSALPCILLAGTYFSTIWPEVNHHVSSNFFALLSVACIVLWQDKNRESLLLAGALAGVTTCFLQPKGMLLLLAILLWL